jgi:tRNA(adenine34) deaminase
MNNNHEELMLEAITESRRSVAEGNGPTGCVIVKNGKIVARGHNEEHSHSDPTAHAEIVTIRRLCAELGSKNLSGYILYSTLQPCGMCSVACLWANISTVVYGASRKNVSNKLFMEESFNTVDFIADSTHKDLIVIPDVLAEECASLYKDLNKK